MINDYVFEFDSVNGSFFHDSRSIQFVKRHDGLILEGDGPVGRRRQQAEQGGKDCQGG